MIFKATILVMTFNHQEYILRFFQYIINLLDNELFEIIVSDDASTDKTIEIVKNYSNKFTNVKIIQNNINLGIMGNLISALSRASGSSIFLISGDDFIISEGYYWSE
jgi:glycosyltransferase involved in cell wall biosynthesis